tara:strand:+ start:160 stop:468 length:309 start_codon:yes stop_codon:yes gene_type:complete
LINPLRVNAFIPTPPSTVQLFNGLVYAVAIHQLAQQGILFGDAEKGLSTIARKGFSSALPGEQLVEYRADGGDLVWIESPSQRQKAKGLVMGHLFCACHSNF